MTAKPMCFMLSKKSPNSVTEDEDGSDIALGCAWSTTVLACSVAFVSLEL